MLVLLNPAVPNTKMKNWTSLFAQKLRSHRIGSGRHGRMTQEELAMILNVSVDAISKYERSLSYIRGDLEYQLQEKLGWSLEDVVACRADWEAGRPQHSGSAYRLLNNQEVLNEFGGSSSAVTEAVACMEVDHGDGLPSGFSAADTIWRDIQKSGLLSGPYVMLGSKIVGHVGLIFPKSDPEKRFFELLFDEAELTPDHLKRPLLPGDYFAYCPAIYVARGHENATRLLLSGFVSELEELLEREIFIREIGAISVNSLGTQLCEDLGLKFLGAHQRYTGFGVWTLHCSDIANSIVGRRSAKLRDAYLNTLPPS
ncbi:MULTISPECIES: helix-turn-helix domain-containing protein [unclassified Ruegeria]|uniref:helix-turn-helix domain-containing protein n=1 Tax=unclassified Ruegeria TaxID=2625375 RepID=UPI0014897966|nr:MULTISPECIES: helix-turn-helix transcriptional regulator [unclassified Ruegeria]NOD65733.1 hypothetical protein [Ruegeria sp. HKCCD6109]